MPATQLSLASASCLPFYLTPCPPPSPARPLPAQALYEACPEWGWSDAKKQFELAHPDARYLVIFAEGQQAQQQQQQQQQQQAGAQQEGQRQQQQGQQRQAAAVAAPAPPGGQENSAAAGNGGGGEGQAAGAGQQQPGQPLAFLHYRFEAEEGEAVLYCYEIQIDAAAQVRWWGRGR